MKAYRTLRGHVQKVLDAYSLNSSQWAILGYLYEHSDGASVNSLAQLLDVKAPLVSVLVAPLLTARLLATAENSVDRRAKSLTITDKGKALVKVVEETLQLRLLTIFSSVSDEDMRSYMDVLQRIIDYRNP